MYTLTGVHKTVYKVQCSTLKLVAGRKVMQ